MPDRSETLAIVAVILSSLEEVKGSMDESARQSVLAILTKLNGASSEKHIQAIDMALEALQPFPSAFVILVRNMSAMAEQIPSIQSNLLYRLSTPSEKRFQTGELYVCPVDPKHYRRRVSNILNPLVCPLHGVALKKY